jgi:hypothetical protein
MDVITIDGYSYPRLPVLSIDNQVVDFLDGDGAGRVTAFGANVIRDPKGAFYNFSVTYGECHSNNSDYVALFNKAVSLGRENFVTVKTKLPTGQDIAQLMYLKSEGVSTKRIFKNGVRHNSTWTIRFIAERSMI